MASQPRLLVVDDDPGTVLTFNRILSNEASISFASSGEETLRLVTQDRPDLILLDAELPGLDGFATCMTLKAQPEYVDLAIIFVTSHDSFEIETRALEIGAVDFIRKPVNPPVLKARVRTQLELKRRGDELQRLASVDGLTGLANRRAFDARLRQEWQRAQRSAAPLSLLMVDIDWFKKLNDCYGHQTGDECLRQVGQVLAAHGQRAGDLAARYGGEEFAIILPHTDPNSAQLVAERVCAAVAGLTIAVPAADSEIRITASLGVATVRAPGHWEGSGGSGTAQSIGHGIAGQGCEGLIAMADRALYSAKQGGRARVVCCEGILPIPVR